MPTLSHVAKQALAVAFGLTVALVLTEIVLRVAHLAPATGVVTVTEREFARIPGLFAPGQHLVDRRNPALPHVVSIDSLGYRGADFPRTKAPAELRVLMVGDSFTYGDFVNDDATLPAQLEARLGKRCAAARVINAGVGGTTIIEHHHMISRALPLAPDLVILTFSENDVSDLAGQSMWDQLADNRRAKSRFPLSFLYPLLRRTALWNLALQLRGSRRAETNAAAVAAPAAGSADASRQILRDGYARRLRALHDSLAAAGVPLAFVVFPDHHALTRPERREHVAWAARTGAAIPVPTLELLPALLGTHAPANELYLLPHDGHPNPRGYTVAADTLAQFVAELPVVRSRCSN